jgi:hypothetical protein
LLTGIEAGERNVEGQYPENTLNFAFQARLKDLAEKVQAFSSNNKAEKENYEYESTSSALTGSNHLTSRH